jgi:hypothetical protein
MIVTCDQPRCSTMVFGSGSCMDCEKTRANAVSRASTINRQRAGERRSRVSVTELKLEAAASRGTGSAF